MSNHNDPQLSSEPKGRQRRGYVTPVAQCNEMIAEFDKATLKLKIMQENSLLAAKDETLRAGDKGHSFEVLREAATLVINTIAPTVYRLPLDTQKHPYYVEAIAAADRLTAEARRALEVCEDYGFNPS